MNYSTDSSLAPILVIGFVVTIFVIVGAVFFFVLRSIKKIKTEGTKVEANIVGARRACRETSNNSSNELNNNRKVPYFELTIQTEPKAELQAVQFTVEVKENSSNLPPALLIAMTSNTKTNVVDMVLGAGFNKKDNEYKTFASKIPVNCWILGNKHVVEIGKISLGGNH